MLYTKEKTINVSYWVEGNEDFVIYAPKQPTDKDEIIYIAPTFVIKGLKDPEKISKAIDKYFSALKSGGDSLWAYACFMTQNYWDSYKRGIYWKFDHKAKRLENYTQSKKLIETKDYSRLAIDMTSRDGFFYNIYGQPISRALHVNYIDSHCRFRYYNNKGISVEKYFEILSKNKKVIDLCWENIPYYNQDEDMPMSKIPVFSYQPGDKEFKNMIKESGGLTKTLWSTKMKDQFWSKLKLLEGK